MAKRQPKVKRSPIRAEVVLKVDRSCCADANHQRFQPKSRNNPFTLTRRASLKHPSGLYPFSAPKTASTTATVQGDTDWLTVFLFATAEPMRYFPYHVVFSTKQQSTRQSVRGSLFQGGTPCLFPSLFFPPFITFTGPGSGRDLVEHCSLASLKSLSRGCTAFLSFTRQAQASSTTAIERKHSSPDEQHSFSLCENVENLFSGLLKDYLLAIDVLRDLKPHRQQRSNRLFGRLSLYRLPCAVEELTISFFVPIASWSIAIDML